MTTEQLVNIALFKIGLEAKIQSLDKEEEEIRQELKRGLWKTEKRRRQKNFIRWHYVQLIGIYLAILEALGGEKKFCEQIRKKRGKQIKGGQSYGEIYKKLKVDDYPKRSWLDLGV